VGQRRGKDDGGRCGSYADDPRPTLPPCARLSTIAAGAAWTKSFHARRFAAAAAAAAGLDPEATFYALRHSFISRALKAGVPAEAVADHCGTSLATIARHCSKLLAENRKRYAALAAPPLRLETEKNARLARLRLVGECAPRAPPRTSSPRPGTPRVPRARGRVTPPAPWPGPGFELGAPADLPRLPFGFAYRPTLRQPYGKCAGSEPSLLC
jgi:hypothetical protein